MAAHLGLVGGLSLNFLPPSLDVYPDAISSSLKACERVGLDPRQIILEVTEQAVISDPVAFAKRINDLLATDAGK